MATYIKKADRSATLSFCPSGPYLAAGSVAGAIDLSFSSASTLEASGAAAWFCKPCGMEGDGARLNNAQRLLFLQ